MPSGSASRRTTSYTFAALIAVLALVRSLLPAVPPNVFVPSRGAIAWPFVVGISALGWAGIWLSRRLGVPEMWDPRVPARWRTIVPALLGAALGVLTIAQAVATGARDERATPFPYSVPVFLYGAIFLETLLRLFLLPLLVGALAKLTRGRWPAVSFGAAALLVSLYEATEFLPDLVRSPSARLFLVVARLVAANLVACVLYWRAGFIAPLTMRLTDYLVWHVVWPAAR